MESNGKRKVRKTNKSLHNGVQRVRKRLGQQTRAYTMESKLNLADPPKYPDQTRVPV
jgi:hypothetical protein